MTYVISLRNRIAAMVVALFSALVGFARDLKAEVVANHSTVEPQRIAGGRGRSLAAPGKFLGFVGVPHAARTGTLSIADLQAVTFQSAAAFGINTIADIFARDLEVHRALVADLLAPIADISADRQRIAGGSDRGTMSEVDEYGRAPTRKVAAGTTVGFPLRGYQYAVGWTRKYLQLHTPAELANQMQAAKKAQLIELARQLKRAIYLSANYTWRDFLVDNIDLNVKRLANADGAAIPDGPNGEQFVGATHTHYLGTGGAFDAADMTAAINTVVEHGHGGQVRVHIAQADEATVRALVGFQAYTDPRIALGTGAVPTTRLDITRVDNRAIGIFGAAEVWVKPWAVAGRALVFDATSGSKPLVVRTRDGQAPTLVIAAELDTFPLHAQYTESEFGVGVWNRTNGAVLDMVNAAYTDPTIS